MATEPLAKALSTDFGGPIAKQFMAAQKPIFEEKQRLSTELGDVERKIAEGQQRQKEVESEGKVAAGERFVQQRGEAQQRMQEGLAAAPIEPFVPTRDTAQDIAGLFSLIGVIGMVVGKGNAQQAMGAMNGMLEGHRKGRADLYKQELSTYEKNFKALLKKHEELRTEFKDAVDTYAVDKELGEQKAMLAAAKSGSPIIQELVRKGEIVRANALIDDVGKSRAKAVELDQQERRHKEAINAANERARLQRDQQEKLAKIKAEQKGGAGAVAGQIERMTNAMTQVSGAINSVATLPITTTAPVFGQKEFKGLFTAPLSALNQKMSKETSQMLQGRMVGVARNLASLETGGAATGLAGLTDSIQSGVAIPAGAKLHVALDRLAEMRRIVEDSARAALASDKYSESQKQLIRENVAIVQKAIPFTLDDVVDATVVSSGRSPKVRKEDSFLSFTDYVNKYGVGKPKASDDADPVTGYPTRNSQGWVLHNDGSGNYAYVSPDGTQYEELEE